MYEIVVEEMFSAAHNLRGYKGKCENIHGHNWKVEVAVRGNNLDNKGFLIDFTILKSIVKRVLKVLDHKNLNDIDFFQKINPTSENIAFYIHSKIKRCLKKYPVEIQRITVWENNYQFATYSEDGTSIRR